MRTQVAIVHKMNMAYFTCFWSALNNTDELTSEKCRAPSALVLSLQHVLFVNCWQQQITQTDRFIPLKSTR